MACCRCRRWWCWSARPVQARRLGRRPDSPGGRSCPPTRYARRSAPVSATWTHRWTPSPCSRRSSRRGLRRRLTTVIDTLGLDRARRVAWVEVARSAGLPAVAIRFDTDAATCRQRNRTRDVPVPADVLTAQLRRTAEVDLAADGFDLVLTADAAPEPAYAPGAVAARAAQRDQPARTSLRPPGLAVPVGRGSAGVARRRSRAAAEEAGFAGLAVMDHLLQIPQVGRAWEPMPEAYTTLGFLAGVTERLELGALVTPVTFRSAPLVAKIIATLDVLSGGRAFCGARRGLVRAGACRVRPGVPAAGRAAGSAGAGDRHAPGDVGPGHQAVRRAARDHRLPAAAARRADHRRWQWRAPHARDRRAARGWLQRAVGARRSSTASSRCCEPTARASVATRTS